MFAHIQSIALPEGATLAYISGASTGLVSTFTIAGVHVISVAAAHCAKYVG